MTFQEIVKKVAAMMSGMRNDTRVHFIAGSEACVDMLLLGVPFPILYSDDALPSPFKINVETVGANSNSHCDVNGGFMFEISIMTLFRVTNPQFGLQCYIYAGSDDGQCSDITL